MLKGFMDTSMNSNFNPQDAKCIAEEIVKVLIEKKGRAIKLFDVKETSSITDYYVNVTGGSNTQVASLADEVVYKLGLLGVEALRVEGRRANEWLLVDYGNVIVNVFDKKSRDYYDLDRHFSPDAIVDITELEREVDIKLGIETD